MNFSWLYLFNRLANYSEKHLRIHDNLKQPLKLARAKYPRPSTEELLYSSASPNSILFLIARHPFERLVSGYCNKFLGPDNGYNDFNNKAKVIRHILVKYRKQSFDRRPTSKVGTKNLPTFTEFVRYLLDETRAGNRLDEHWAPVYSFCNPCQVNVTHIIKFETFDRDTKRILEKAKLSHYLPASGKIRENSSGRNSKSLCQVDNYLNELPPNLQKELYEMYKIDFDLFGYHDR